MQKGKQGFQPTSNKPVKPKTKNQKNPTNKTRKPHSSTDKPQHDVLLAHKKITNPLSKPTEEPAQVAAKNRIIRTVDENGIVKYTLNGQLHNPSGPAVEHPHKRKEWWTHGKRNNTDGPAVEEGQHKEWWRDNQLDRPDGPVIETGAFSAWYRKGERHRLDGPAIEWADGTKRWWVDGQTTTYPELCEQAILPHLTHQAFQKLCTHQDYVVRQLATHNPHCPPKIKQKENHKQKN